MSTLSCIEHVVHLLEHASSEIDSQATPRNIVLAAHERWVLITPTYNIQEAAVCLHNYRLSQVILLTFPVEIILSLLVRHTLLADKEVCPDAPLRSRDFEKPDAR